jgi:hypothetical protein
MSSVVQKLLRRLLVLFSVELPGPVSGPVPHPDAGGIPVRLRIIISSITIQLLNTSVRAEAATDQIIKLFFI